MIDTSRHFYAVDFIKHTLDAMEMNRMNVLHIHVTDDESFPMQSKYFMHMNPYTHLPMGLYVYMHI